MNSDEDHKRYQSSLRSYDENDNEIISLNVGGQPFKFCARTLRTRYPNAKLARFVCADHASRRALCAAYLPTESVYFFERSSRLFESVYRLYVNWSGSDGATAPSFCCRDAGVCEAELRAEFSYWELPVLAGGEASGSAGDEMKRCRSCSSRSKSLQLALMQRKSSAFGHPQILRGDTPSLASNISASRRAKETRIERIYRFCEGDGTLQSMLFITVSISFVILSVVGLVLGSIQELQVPYRVNGGNVTLVGDNPTIEELNGAPEKSPSIIWEPLPVFGYLETMCIIWFTGEYFLRIVVAPNRLQFASQLVNVVDLIAILPFYLEMVLALCGFDVTRLSEIKGAFLVVRIMRVLRVVRILKLGRYSSGMRTFALTLRSSARQLGMMGMVLFTGVVFFSTLLYFVEKDEPRTPFTSIPAAFWWAIVTMSTVGYGDFVPVTILGKLIASGAILSGVLVLALPITIIVDNFMRVSGSFSTNPFTGGMVAYDECEHPAFGQKTLAEHGALLSNGRATYNNDKESC